MSAANYALCDSCDGKVFYVGEMDVPLNAVVTHVEQMETGLWWMAIGGVTVWVDADRDGRPTAVIVYGPGEWAQPVDGVTYECEWSNIRKGKTDRG